MSTKCNGCDSALYDILYMECSQERCKKIYHLRCLGFTNEQFAELSEEYKSSWICPACKCSIPKMGNSDTPIKAAAMPAMNETFTPSSFVNLQPRGSRNKVEASNVRNDAEILGVLKELRMEMKSQQDEQVKSFKRLQEQLNAIEIEIKDLRKNMTVVDENAKKLDQIEILIHNLGRKEVMEERVVPVDSSAVGKEAPLTFAKVLQQRDQGVAKSLPANKSQATKPAEVSVTVPPHSATFAPVQPSDGGMEDRRKSQDGVWETVNRTKRKYPRKEVKQGGCKQSLEIEGTEQKKSLHVWRVKKGTTVESMVEFVKKICGKNAEIKVDGIKHKQERNYESFIITVPESLYEKLSEDGNWAVNIKYCEWDWFFRRDTQVTRY